MNMANADARIDGGIWWHGLRSVLVSDAHAFADGFGFFDFVDEGDGEVFSRDAAFAQFVGEKLIAARAKFGSAPAGFDHPSGANAGPIKVGGAVDVQGIAIGSGDGKVGNGEAGEVDKLQAR